MILRERALVERILSNRIKLIGTEDVDYQIDARETQSVLLKLSNKKNIRKGHLETVKLTGHVWALSGHLLIEYNPALHEAGSLTGPTVLDRSNDSPVSFHIRAKKDMDLTELDYLAKVYIVE